MDYYITAFLRNVQDTLEELTQTIQNSAPDAKETISCQMPAFKLYGSLVCFAAFKNHNRFYPTSSGISEFRKELSHYEVAKGTVRFPIDEPIPFEPIRKTVEFNGKKNLDKNRSRGQGKKELKTSFLVE